jgi:hypothetical protein
MSEAYDYDPDLTCVLQKIHWSIENWDCLLSIASGANVEAYMTTRDTSIMR